jgi:hemerythrin-like domain-containing protein
MDILTLLKNDHQAILGLLEEAAHCDPGDAQLERLCHSISAALTVHSKLEEALFYQPLRDCVSNSDEMVEVFGASTEHDIIRHILSVLKSDGRRDEPFLAELKVLRDFVTHHFNDEENTTFALAGQLLGEETLELLGNKLEERRAELYQLL